jgi:hypothetical protein
MRTMSKTGMIFLMAGIAAFASQNVVAQTGQPARAPAAAKAPASAATPKAAAAPSGPLSLSDTLKAAQDALGMLRNVNRVDAINTMEFWASGTAGNPADATKTDYHVTLAYNPPAMRVVDARTTAKGTKQRTIQVVNEKVSWDETEVGAGLDDTVKGTATPNQAAYEERSLQIWIFPYGALKAAVAAGDKAQMSKEGELTVIAFPLSGRLAGVTERVTLGAKNLVTKVETKSDDPARTSLITETTYSNYADLGEIKSDVKFPGHIVRKQGGKQILDITVTKDDPNNPYLVFPAPEKVLQAAAQ